MSAPQVVVTIPWQGEGETGKAVFEVHVRNILEAVRANASNYEVLEDIRKMGILIQMEAEQLQGQLKYGPAKNTEMGVL